MTKKLIAFVLFAASVSLGAAEIGPDKGTLMIVGGNMRDPALYERFIELAGGTQAPIVIVPTAGDDETYDQVLDRPQTVA